MSSTWLSKRQAHQPFFIMKMILRITAIAFTIASIISAVVVDFDGWVGTYITFFLGAWAISFFWNLIWLLVHIGRERPIAHGLAVAIDLIATLWYAVATVFGWLELSNVENYAPFYGSQYAQDTNLYPGPQMIGPIVSASVFALLATIVEFWLFVHACVDEDRRRKSSRKALEGKSDKTVVINTSQHCAIACVDCLQPVQVRCPHCAAKLVSTESSHDETPVYLGPQDPESGFGKPLEHDLASIESEEPAKKSAIRRSLK